MNYKKPSDMIYITEIIQSKTKKYHVCIIMEKQVICSIHLGIQTNYDMFSICPSSSANTPSFDSFSRVLAAFLDSMNLCFSSGVRFRVHCSTSRIVWGKGRPNVSVKNSVSMAARMLIVPNTQFGSQGTLSVWKRKIHDTWYVRFDSNDSC